MLLHLTLHKCCEIPILLAHVCENTCLPLISFLNRILYTAPAREREKVSDIQLISPKSETRDQLAVTPEKTVCNRLCAEVQLNWDTVYCKNSLLQSVRFYCSHSPTCNSKERFLTWRKWLDQTLRAFITCLTNIKCTCKSQQLQASNFHITLISDLKHWVQLEFINLHRYVSSDHNIYSTAYSFVIFMFTSNQPRFHICLL